MSGLLPLLPADAAPVSARRLRGTGAGAANAAISPTIEAVRRARQGRSFATCPTVWSPWAVQVVTTYLQQTSPDQVVPASEPAEPLVIARAEEPSPEFTRFLLTAVGGQWHWTDKLDRSWAQWWDWVTRKGFETWVAWRRGTPVGYAELMGSPGEGGTDVEIESFGLLPAFVGKGFGGHLLTRALQEAWRIDSRWPGLAPVRRVWLHTCTLDSAHALPNYRRRGLQPYDTRSQEQDVIAEPPGPWPGSGAPQRPTSAGHEVA